MSRTMDLFKRCPKRMQKDRGVRLQGVERDEKTTDRSIREACHPGGDDRADSRSQEGV